MERNLYTAVDDIQFSGPYIDVDEWRDTPVRHRYVHGGFEGTQSRFCFYFPEKDGYKGRFFQKLAPVQGPETTAQAQVGEEDVISFSILHGAYFVETNMGGIVNGGDDHTLVYRCSACAVQFSRKLAAEMYGGHRPYGYVFGGSGGGFKTIGAVESTEGIWDGAVPFVIGSPVAMPNVFTVRAHAMRLLRNKFREITDAIEPGGSGDPYGVLNEEEADALREAVRMGFPMETWCEYETIGEGALPVLYPAIPMMDPSYFTDFWEKEGYLGADPNGSAVRDRIKYVTKIRKNYLTDTVRQGMADTIDPNNAYGVDEAWKHAFGNAGGLPVLELEEFPEGDQYTKGLKLRFMDGPLSGEQFSVQWLSGKIVAIQSDVSGRNLAELLQKADAGNSVEIDNSDYIAVQTYHRHQVPGPEYPAWNQFRDSRGNPLYPQRPLLVGPILALGGAGSVQQGNPTCKVIVLESLMDESAFPWQADWYRRKIQEHFGTDGNDVMRLWYMEHCMHTDCEEGNGGDHQHIVSYLGALYQALLDVSDWVERGIEPAATSGYSIEEGIVHIPDSVQARGGIQPMVALTAEGQIRKEVKVGERVSFEAVIRLPAGSGALEEVTWDFEATNCFEPVGSFSETVWHEDGTGEACAEAEQTFMKPGIYFPVVKAASNRTPGDMFTRIRNQARMRVVVRE